MKRNVFRIASLATGALLVASSLTFAAEAAGRGGAGQRSSGSQRVCTAKGGSTGGSATAKRSASQNGTAKARKAGPGDGTGNQGSGPKDGTGYGAGQANGNGTGTCDGTGPKGSQNGNKGGKP